MPQPTGPLRRTSAGARRPRERRQRPRGRLLEALPLHLFTERILDQRLRGKLQVLARPVDRAPAIPRVRAVHPTPERAGVRGRCT